MRFLKYNSSYYELTGVTISERPDGQIRFNLLNGQNIYFHDQAAELIRQFLILEKWPDVTVLDVGHIWKYLTPQQSVQNILPGSPNLPERSSRRQNLVQMPVLPPVTHPGFPMGYGSDYESGTFGEQSLSPINTNKSHASELRPVPGVPKLNISAIRKSAGIKDEI